MKLTDEQKILIVQACRDGTATIEQLADRFSVSPSTIDRVLKKTRAGGGTVKIRRGRPSKSKWCPGEHKPSFDIRPVKFDLIEKMCAIYHAYGSIGPYSVYSFAVFEGDVAVAAFSWQTPPFGAANTICPEAPSGVLALSRMVAIPRGERRLRHISKPLRYQMKQLIDRTRWPVLITYSDEGQGHTGHVYKCSGWQPTIRTRRNFYIDEEGRRRGIPAKKDPDQHYLRYGGKTTLLRWEHRICDAGKTADWMALHGWRRIDTGRVWRSGNPASKWVRA